MVKARVWALKEDAMHPARRSQRYQFPEQVAHAPTLPGVLLLFSADALVHVSATGNLRDELIMQGPRHQTDHFAYEVIFDHQWRTARAAELAQHLRRTHSPPLT